MKARFHAVYPGRLHSCGRTRVELRSNSTHPETAPSQAFRRGVKRSHDMRFAPQGSSRKQADRQPQPVTRDPPETPPRRGFSLGQIRRPLQMLKDYRCGATAGVHDFISMNEKSCNYEKKPRKTAPIKRVGVMYASGYLYLNLMARYAK